MYVIPIIHDGTTKRYYFQLDYDDILNLEKIYPDLNKEVMTMVAECDITAIMKFIGILTSLSYREKIKISVLNPKTKTFVESINLYKRDPITNELYYTKFSTTKEYSQILSRLMTDTSLLTNFFKGILPLT